ncbi:MAG TPA: CYTH and CHAD domain-containing protein [Streptosporangiaceae bacterium]
MSTTVYETEIKYEAPPGTTVPQLGGLPSVAGASGPEEQLLEAEYYDTSDLRLIRNGITLRRRRGGSDPGWHLKLPAGGSTRREIQVPPGRGGRQVPARLASLVRGYTRGETLRPVARISTRRQVLTLLDSAGASLAEIAADDVSAQTMGEETMISQWAEVEVELTGGGPRLLKAADAQLRRDGLQPSARAAKLERALGWPAEDGPARTQPAATANGRRGEQHHSAPVSAGDVVVAYLQEHAARLGAMDPLVRGDEPDAVHQMRVSTRRLRSTLQTFAEVIPRSGTEKILAELKWLGGVLGEARDAEVLASRLSQNVRTIPAEVTLGPVQARVQGHFAPIQAAARRNVLAALDSARYFALRDALDGLLADPPWSAEAARPAGRVLPAAAHHAYRRTRRRIRKAGATSPGRPRELAYHEARKAAKRARYAGETISPALGKAARRFTKQMKKVQTVLGDHQDAVVARGADRELGIGAHLAGENAFTYGLLYDQEDQRAVRLQAKAQRAWKRAHRPRLRH